MPPELPYKPYANEIWRLVEAQHIVSTTKLVDSGDEQELLEKILESTKPPVPPECQHLHYLLCTPFRYGRYPWDSRFRRMGETPGVFYGAEDPITAVAETVWQRKIFFEGSPGTPLPKEPGTYTAFSVSVHVPVAVDLTEPPMSSDEALWTDPVDYSACLDLADRVRGDGCELIRYTSVRHPHGLPNIAVLTCQAFDNSDPMQSQTWYLFLRPGRTQVRREHPKVSLEFKFGKIRLELA